MIKKLKLVAFLSFSFFIGAALYAEDIFITPTGGGDHSGSSWSNAINGGETIIGLRIRDAITNAVANGAEEVNVYLAGGIYTTTNQITLSSIAVPVEMSGGYLGVTDGSFEMGATATEFKRSTYNIRFIEGSSLSSFAVDGITFSGGYVYQKNGAIHGGAFKLSNSTTLIKNCIFSGNIVKGGSYATCYGGAIYASGGVLTIKNSSFNANYVNGGYKSQYGGGIYTVNTDISIYNCNLEGNYALASQCGGYGGALSIHGKNVVIKNSIFKKNYVYSNSNTGTGYPHGGAFSIRSAVRAEIADCQFFDNYVRVFNKGRSAATISCFYFDDFNAGDGVMTSVVTRCVFDSSGVANQITSNNNSKYFKSDFLLNCGRLFMTNCLVANARGSHEAMKYSIRVQQVAPSEKDPVSGKNTIVVTPCELNLVNCTIADGKGNGAIAFGANSKMNLENCILWGNTLTGIVNAASVKYTCSQEEHEGEGNFVADPILSKPYYHLITKAKNGYIQDGYFGGTFNGEKSAVSSPCIDAGITNAPNHLFEPHARGSRINLGAYGGTPWASKTYYQLGSHLRIY